MKYLTLLMLLNYYCYMHCKNPEFLNFLHNLSVRWPGNVGLTDSNHKNISAYYNKLSLSNILQYSVCLNILSSMEIGKAPRKQGHKTLHGICLHFLVQWAGASGLQDHCSVLQRWGASGAHAGTCKQWKRSTWMYHRLFFNRENTLEHTDPWHLHIPYVDCSAPKKMVFGCWAPCSISGSYLVGFGQNNTRGHVDHQTTYSLSLPLFFLVAIHHHCHWQKACRFLLFVFLL